MAPMKKITSLDHPLVKHFVKLKDDPAYRKLHNKAIILGKKLIQELQKVSKIHTLITLEEDEHLDVHAEQNIIVTKSLLKKISGTVNPEPFIAEISIPAHPMTKFTKMVVCDRIQDPGNLGTIIRTALCFDCDAIYIIDGCVDPFNEKVIRSSKGSSFKIPLIYGSEEEFITFCKLHQIHPYQMDLQGQNIITANLKTPFAIVLGNEGVGTSNFLKRTCDALTIPISKNFDSLNVAIAAGIALFIVSSNQCQK